MTLQASFVALLRKPNPVTIRVMKRVFSYPRPLSILCGLLVLFDAPPLLMAQPPAAAVSVFLAYTLGVETRLAKQHRSQDTFLARPATDLAATSERLRRGEFIIEHVVDQVDPAPGEPPGAVLHHWRGTAFASGAHAADFERLLRDFSAYPQRFAPQVLCAGAATPEADRTSAWMRVRQHHVITVVMDSSYDVGFGRLDTRHGYSISQSTRVAEVDGAGTSAERVLTPAEEHGFLWRLNTYWSYEERDGGLYLQIEAVSLTRSVPRGLGWIVKPYVESIPRESLEFTLRSALNALRKP